MENNIIEKWIVNLDSFAGSSSGSSSGDGCGSGDGSGYGSGYGCGDGYFLQIKKHTKRDVHYIDSIPTIIVSIFGNYAKGFVIREDTFELTKCYLAKDPVSGKVAHGDTLKEASVALYAKITDSMTVEEKIESFCAQFEKGKKYKGKVFFDWHHILTGSCMFGRKQFVDEHHLSLEDEYTVDQFIEICENAYGAEEIRKLKERWN